MNSNGYLSLAEIDRGLLITLGVNEESELAVKHCKPAIIRAFQVHKSFIVVVECCS